MATADQRPGSSLASPVPDNRPTDCSPILEIRRVCLCFQIILLDYVSHDQSEALAPSDRIAIMHNGAIVQIGAPRQIYDQPRDAFVAMFVGRSNLLRGTLQKSNQQTVRIATVLGHVTCKGPILSRDRAPGAALIRPEHVVLKATGSGTGDAAINGFRGPMVQLAFSAIPRNASSRLATSASWSSGLSDQYNGANEVEVFFPPEHTSAIVVDE